MTSILLAIDWAVVGIKAAQLILSLSILVTIHELGHFIAARVFGCRVERLYLFFNPYFSIAAFKKIKGKWQSKFFYSPKPEHEVITDENGNPILDKKGKKQYKKIDTKHLPDDDWRKYPESTRYGIGWVPMGGYVSISGMIDESMDTAQMKEPAKPYEFRSKPAWQRLIIMLAGIIFNVILAYIIYSAMLWKYGQEYMPVSSMKYGIAADSLAKSYGFKDGDKVIAANGVAYEKLSDLNKDLLLKDITTVTVDRNGTKQDIVIPKTVAKELIATKTASFFVPRIPALPIKEVAKNMEAAKAGFKPGDLIISADSTPLNYNNEVRNYIKSHAGQNIKIKVLRGKDTVVLPTAVSDAGSIGIDFDMSKAENLFTTKKTTYTFWQALGAGFATTGEKLQDYWLQLKMIFGGKVAAKDSVGSLLTIGNIFPATWNWTAFWELTALLSIILAVMNLLPIPGLDGGHAVFCLYEMVTGRKPTDKFMEVAQTVGMILLFALMAFALGNDIRRLF